MWLSSLVNDYWYPIILYNPFIYTYAQGVGVEIEKLVFCKPKKFFNLTEKQSLMKVQLYWYSHKQFKMDI